MDELTAQQRTNLNLNRRAFDAFDAGDVDGVLALLDPEVEVYMPNDLPNSGTFRGHEGYLKWVGNWLEAWDDFTVEIREIEPVGERHVVAHARQSATGKGSGIPVEMEIAYMTETRDGRAIALHLYQSADEARRVAAEREARSLESRR
jgi:ketosteroid isomerase-like protein